MKLDAIKLAKEAGFTMKPPEWVPAQTQQLERFAALVIDECIKSCNEIGEMRGRWNDPHGSSDAFECVAALREMKQ